MSVSTHVVGIKPPDAKWKKMKIVYDACIKAGVDVPEEVDKFFDGHKPDEKGVLIDLKEGNGVSHYNADMEDGYEIELAKLPKGIKIIRFVNSY